MHLIAFDVSFCCWRSFHSHGGKDPFASVLLAVYEMERTRKFIDPRAVPVFAFDRKPYKRNELYLDYKKKSQKGDDGEREAKEELLRQVDKLRTKYLEQLGLPNALSSPGCEADDVFASLVAKTSYGDLRDQITIVSRDQDLYQLLSSRVRMFDPIKRQFYTHRDFRDEYDLHPTQWPQVKALGGCESDNIDGPPGIAQGRALKHVSGEKPNKVCKEFMETEAYQVNLKLTTLPYLNKAIEFDISTESAFQQEWWVCLCSALDREALAEFVLGVRS